MAVQPARLNRRLDILFIGSPLAGECVALLLNKLSQSPEALNTAMTKTQGWWHSKTQRHGSKKRQILTVGNVELALKLPYVVERNHRSRRKVKSSQSGFCPFLRWLGIEEGLTPLAWSTIQGKRKKNEIIIC